MRKIYQIDQGFLGKTAELEPGRPAPAGWTFTAPPEAAQGSAAKWAGDGWVLVPASEADAAKSALEAKQREQELLNAASAIAARRYAAEVAGIQWQGYGIATDRDSQDKVDKEDRAVDKGMREDGKGWKCLDLATGQVGFRPTTNAEMQEIAAAVYAYVSSCFAREGELLAALADGTYTDDMLADGWPSQAMG